MTVVPAATALAVTVAVSPVVLTLLRRAGILDVPNARSSHTRPVPRAGGLAVATGALAGLAVAGPLPGASRAALIAAPLAFGALGLAEDLRGVPALARLGLQVVVATALLPLVLQGLDGHLVWRLVFAAAVLVWLVAYVNAFNFMDGINGISWAQAALAGLAWFALGIWAGVPALATGGLVVSAAATGFAPFNFPAARMFLGDVGSYFLGSWLAVLVIVGLRAGLPPEAVVAPLGAYLADTAATIVRRVRRGEVWYRAHRDHAYQRLVQAGWSHARTTGFVAAVIAVSSALGAASLSPSLGLRVAGAAALVGVLCLYLASPSLLARSPASPLPAA